MTNTLTDDALCAEMKTRLGRFRTFSVFDNLRKIDRDAFEALEMVAREIVRQRDDEEWSIEHDDGHIEGELALAAASYAQFAGAQAKSQRRRTPAPSPACPPSWPWDIRWWKPKTTPRNLVRAAALLIVEHGRWMRAFATNFSATDDAEKPNG